MSMQIAILKKPKRRAPIWPWVIIICWLISIVAPIALVYGVFYDDATKKVNVDENFSIAEMGNRAIVDSLDTSTEGKLAISLSGDDMDNILLQAMTKANLINAYMKKAYVVIKGNKYNFYLDLNAGEVFKSRVKLSTELTEENNTFYFTVKDIAIGRLSGILTATKGLIDTYVTPELVDKVFQDVGLSIKYDRENMRLCYAKSDVISDLNGLASGSSDSDMGIYFNIIKTLMDEGLAKFNTTSNSFLDCEINIAPLSTNELVTDDAAHIKVKSEEVTTRCKNNVVRLIENGVLNPERDNLEVFFSYLFVGYNSLTDEQKAQIDEKNFSSIGISDKKAYRGFDLNHDEEYLTHQLEGKIMTFKELLQGRKEISLLYESDLNTYIEGKNILGFTTLLHRQDGENYKVNYVTVDNFYSNLYETNEKGIVEFVCKVNINGYPTSLTFETSVIERDTDQNELTFKVNDNGIHFGQISADYLNDQFFELMANALNSADATVSADKDAHTVTINLTPMVSKAKESILNEFDKLFSSLDELSVLLITGKPKSVLKEEFVEYVEGLFVPSNAEVKVTGKNRNINGEMILRLKENNPPEEIAKILELVG